jgi:hypothetical protein
MTANDEVSTRWIGQCPVFELYPKKDEIAQVIKKEREWCLTFFLMGVMAILTVILLFLFGHRLRIPDFIGMIGVAVGSMTSASCFVSALRNMKFFSKYPEPAYQRVRELYSSIAIAYGVPLSRFLELSKKEHREKSWAALVALAVKQLQEQQLVDEQLRNVTDKRILAFGQGLVNGANEALRIVYDLLRDAGINDDKYEPIFKAAKELIATKQ